MYKQGALSCIPEVSEHNEDSEEKWVPKKKHDVLKAKYKCLKKLFEIYDTNIIGFLPEASEDYTEETQRRRRKRSHRSKTDACAGTDSQSDGKETSDQSQQSDSNINNLTLECKSSNNVYYEYSNSKETVPYAEDIKGRRISHLLLNERHRPTRFQCFIQRLFGIRRDTCLVPNENYPSSENYTKSKRRRGSRYRKLKRTKKNKSEGDLNTVKNPIILSCVQSVQKNCLLDRTPRLCPMVGCKMITYGIINYNDHLNLYHFKEKKFICTYCHEGFETEHYKYMHENDHIGINKLTTNISNQSTGTESSKTASDSQTDPDRSETRIPNDKLKKIVSFFDKFQNIDNTELKKNIEAETNLQPIEFDDSEIWSSCINIRKKCEKYDDSESLKQFRDSCRYCEENFLYRRQLPNQEHKINEKFFKFHSCTGILHRPLSVDGQISYQSKSKSCLSEDTDSVGNLDESLSCDPSTNIVHYSSLDKKPSLVETFVKKVKSYKWESGTKIIRV